MTPAAARRVAAPRPAAPCCPARPARTPTAGHARARTARARGRTLPTAAGAAGTRACARRAAWLLHAQLAQRLRAVGPVLAHLHPQVQVQAPAQQCVQLAARGAADALQALALRADHDGLL